MWFLQENHGPVKAATVRKRPGSTQSSGDLPAHMAPQILKKRLTQREKLREHLWNASL